ncbi:MAG: anaerobic ribonucleoside-triphosphate reductase activating protein [Candidatus Thorarchaeota archaeon]
MRISTIIDISLVDVPGIPVTVIFTAGCNFDCPYCQNAEIIPSDSGTDLTIQEIIAKSVGHLSKGHCITGGEPTIQADLPQLLKELRAAGSGHINLNTNGTNPSILQQCIPFLDSVWLDLKTSPEKYNFVARTAHNHWSSVLKSINSLLNSDVAFWPRTTYAGSLMTPEDIEHIAKLLSNLGYKGKYLVQNYIESSGVRDEEISNLATPDRAELEYLEEMDFSGVEVVLEWR